MGQVLLCRGHFAAAIPMLDEVARAPRADMPTGALQIGLSYRGVIHYWQTEYARAESLMGEAAATAADRGDAFNVLVARMFVALSRIKLGRVSEGLAALEEAITLARRNRDRFWLPRLVVRMGWAHREVLAPQRAREFSTEALRLSREMELPQASETEALLDLAVDEVRLGHAEKASALLGELEARVEEDGEWMRWMNDLRLAAASVEHWSTCRNWDRAVEGAGRLFELARDLGSRDYHCAAERVRAEAALARGVDLEDHTKRLAAALAELRRFPAPLEAWKSARLLGILHRQCGAEDEARSAFAEGAVAVRRIADGLTDPTLRSGFLSAEPVREILAAASDD
jgi:tetratricopeptide (TPR) repeat protein